MNKRIEFGKFSFFLPVAEITGKVRHYAPRKACMFEKDLMYIVKKFSNDPEIKNFKLIDIFSDILCVPDFDMLVVPVINKLITLEVIKCIGDISNPGTIKLSELELTASGEKMLLTGSIPAQEKENIFNFTYDPTDESVLGKKESEHTYPEASGIVHEIERQLLIPSEDIITKRLKAGGETWYNPECEIRSITTDIKKIKWLKITGTIVSGEDGKAVALFQNQKYSQLLNGEHGKEILLRVAETLENGNFNIAGVNSFNTADAGLIIESAESFIKNEELADTVTAMHSKIVFTGPFEDGENFIGEKTKIHVCFDPGAKHRTSIETNTPAGKAFIKIKKNMPVDNCLAFNDARANICAAEFEIGFHGEAHSLPAAYRVSGDSIKPFITEAYDAMDMAIESAMADNNNDIALLLAIRSVWRGAESQFKKFGELVKRLETGASDKIELLSDAKKIFNTYSSVSEILFNSIKRDIIRHQILNAKEINEEFIYDIETAAGKDWRTAYAGDYLNALKTRAKEIDTDEFVEKNYIDKGEEEDKKTLPNDRRQEHGKKSEEKNNKNKKAKKH